MQLFDDIQRTELRPKRQNEPTFEYWNLSARPGVCDIRDLLESWYEHIPDSAKTDLRARFRAPDEVPHQSAFFELYWHELLLRSGYQVEPHPTLPGVSAKVDFLAWRDGTPSFYVEATLAMPPRDFAADRRFAELQDSLNRMNSPNFYLSIESRGTLTGTIRARKLRTEIEQWLNSLDVDEISDLYSQHGYSEIPKFHYSEQGVELTFLPVPKSPQYRGQSDRRPIGITMPEARWLRTQDDIRAAIDRKASKYGALTLPLLLVVNVMDDHCDKIDLMNGLFGDEQIVVSRLSDGQYQTTETRAPNGAWRGKEALKM